MRKYSVNALSYIPLSAALYVDGVSELFACCIDQTVSPQYRPGATNFNLMKKMQLPETILESLSALGISPEQALQANLPFHTEAAELALAETDASGAHHRLIPAAAGAWHEMKHAARCNGIEMHIVSAFRDIAEQSQIIRDKLDRRMPLATIFSLSAPPGFSEHHTGRAVDINTPGCVPREEPFEETAAFAWLNTHAKSFGFILSYPRGNARGFVYEPWHWYYVR